MGQQGHTVSLCSAMEVYVLTVLAIYIPAVLDNAIYNQLITICSYFYYELQDFLSLPHRPPPTLTRSWQALLLFAIFDSLTYLAASPSSLQMLLTCSLDSEALPSPSTTVRSRPFLSPLLALITPFCLLIFLSVFISHLTCSMFSLSF